MESRQKNLNGQLPIGFAPTEDYRSVRISKRRQKIPYNQQNALQSRLEHRVGTNTDHDHRDRRASNRELTAVCYFTVLRKEPATVIKPKQDDKRESKNF